MIKEKKVNFPRNAVMTAIFAIACQEACAVPLTLEWVTTRPGTFSSSVPLPPGTDLFASFTATLVLANDSLVTTGSFFERPPQLLTPVGATPFSRQAVSFTPNPNPYAARTFSGDTFLFSNYPTPTIAADYQGNCSLYGCYTIDLHEDISIGLGRYVGQVSLANEAYQVNLSSGMLSFTADFDVYYARGLDGYWQVKASDVPVPASALLALVGLAALGLAKRRSAEAP